MPCYQLLTPHKPRGGHLLVSFSLTLIPLQLWSFFPALVIFVIDYQLIKFSSSVQYGTDIKVPVAVFVCLCRWPRLGLSTAPVRMSLMLLAVSSV